MKKTHTKLIKYKKNCLLTFLFCLSSMRVSCVYVFEWLLLLYVDRVYLDGGYVIALAVHFCFWWSHKANCFVSYYSVAHCKPCVVASNQMLCVSECNVAAALVIGASRRCGRFYFAFLVAIVCYLCGCFFFHLFKQL